MMKKNFNRYYLILIFFIIGLFFYRYSSYHLIKSKDEISFTSVDQGDFKQLVPVQKTTPFSLAEEGCQSLKDKYADIKELKKNEKTNFRFENIHKKIDHSIFRLRHFFKDGDEKEIEVFLVYQEDQNEKTKIVEKGHNKKGPLYLKIEKNEGEILYLEEGLELITSNTTALFFHYVDHRLMGLQGQIKGPPDSQNIDCRFI